MDQSTRVRYLSDADLVARLLSHGHELGTREFDDVRRMAIGLQDGSVPRLTHHQRNLAEQIFCKLRLRIEAPEPQKSQTTRAKAKVSPTYWWDGKDRSRPWNHPTRPPGRKP